MVISEISLIKEVILECGFREILDYVKGNDEDEVIIPSNQEKFRELVPYLNQLNEIPELSDIDYLDEFLQNYRIAEVEDKLALVSKEATQEDIEEKMRELKSRDLEQNINILSPEQIESFRLAKEPKEVEREIADIFDSLDREIQSLINLSAEVEELYKNDNDEEAEDIKANVVQRFGDSGIRFVNCYNEGYIEGLVKKLDGESVERINEEMKKIWEMPIFFIYKEMNVREIEKVMNRIKGSLNQEENYIAIHGLGKASKIAKTLENSIETPSDSTYKEFKVDKSGEKFSKAWYKGEEGERMLSYLETSH